MSKSMRQYLFRLLPWTVYSVAYTVLMWTWMHSVAWTVVGSFITGAHVALDIKYWTDQ